MQERQEVLVSTAVYQELEELIGQRSDDDCKPLHSSPQTSKVPECRLPKVDPSSHGEEAPTSTTLDRNANKGIRFIRCNVQYVSQPLVTCGDDLGRRLPFADQ
jgi:hypothetical protein